MPSIALRLSSAAAARWTFAGFSILLLPVMVVASFDFGVTWDEMDRYQYGVKVWEFIRGLRPRSSFAETGGHVYPGLFDTICAAAISWVEADRFVVRHVINAIFGWIGVVYCGRLAGRLFGPWAGVLAAVLLALSPRYFGSSMNNPKDLPFAAMSVMALYYISTVSPRWPYVGLGTGVKIAVSLALALNIRVGALLYVGYLGVLVAALVMIERCTDWRRLADTAARVGLVAVAVLLMGTLFWPWAGGAPFTRPFEALLGAAGYPWDGLVLYAGRSYPAPALPWHYAPWWFLISTPPIVLAGLVGSAFFAAGRADVLRRLGLWGVIVLPIAAGMQSTLYDAVRHLTFVYPPMVVLAAAGWGGFLSRARSPMWRLAAAVVLAAGLVHVGVVNVRLHPHQGVYFNALVGGPSGAFKRYEMDYWGNCILPAVEWASNIAQNYGTPVTVSGVPPHLVYLNAQRFPSVGFSDRSENRHHLFIETARGHVAAFRHLASGPALRRIETPDGAVLCRITAGPALHRLGDASPDGGAGEGPR